jgi:hypothetical protein
MTIYVSREEFEELLASLNDDTPSPALVAALTDVQKHVYDADSSQDDCIDCGLPYAAAIHH